MKRMLPPTVLAICLVFALLVAHCAAEGADGGVRVVGPGFFNSQRIALNDRPKVIQDGDVIRAELANGCVVRLNTAEVALEVRDANGIRIAAIAPGKIASLTYLPLGLGVEPVKAEAAFEYQRTISLGETVVFCFAVVPADGKKGTLEWSFQPVSMRINGKEFAGVADQMMLMDKHHYIHKLRIDWLGPGGDLFEGSRSFRFACYVGGPPAEKKCYRDVTFGKARKQSLHDWGSFYDGGQFFHLLGLPGESGTIFEHLDYPVMERSGMASNRENDSVATWHRFYVGRMGPTYCTPRRLRLWTAAKLDHNLWMEMLRYLRLKFAKKFDIQPTTPKPIMEPRNVWRKVGGFREYAKTILPKIKELGYRRVEIGWIWKRGRAASADIPWTQLYHLEDGEMVQRGGQSTQINGIVTEDCGGIEGIKYLTDRAHKLGMEVYVWHQTAHGWQGSRDVQNHPEWLVYGYDGKLAGWGDDPVPVVWFNLKSGWKDVALQRLAALKKATGLDGLWLDVYGAGVSISYFPATLPTSPSIDERLDYTRSLRKMGYGLLSEGISTTCVDAFVLYPHANIHGNEFSLYGTSPFRYFKMQFPGKIDLFRAMAYQCFPRDSAVLFAGLDEKHGGQAVQEKMVQEVRYRNACYNLIEDELGEVVGVLETPGGTQWICERGNALFFFDGGSQDVTAGRPMRPAHFLAPGAPYGGQPRSLELPAGTQQKWKVQAPAKSLLILKTLGDSRD